MKRRLELKAARVRKGWTQLHLAIALSVSQQTIAKWELGAITPGNLATLRELERILGVPKEVLFPDVFIFNKGGDLNAERSFDSARGGRSVTHKPLVSVRHDAARDNAALCYR